MRRKACVLRQIASAVGYSRETVRQVLKLDGRFPSRVPYPQKPPRLCCVSGCKRKHSGRGYCVSHLGKLKRGTMNAKGRPIRLRRICRICGTPFYVPAPSASRAMCDECRPPLPDERSSYKEISNRHERVLQLKKRGKDLVAIGKIVALSVSSVRGIIREAQQPSLRQIRTSGLCEQCGEKRNRFARYCDGCHEVRLVKQRERLRRAYKQVPRCNAIGCRQKPMRDGFCTACHEAWRSRKIDDAGKHVLTACVQCRCRFIPRRVAQKRRISCSKKRSKKAAQMRETVTQLQRKS